MKAEQIAQSYSLVDKYGAADITAIEAMQEYARIQIEKDRKRIFAEHHEDVFLSLEKVLVSTPIILD